MSMIGYMWLGAWILTLIILGLIVVSTGLPDDGTGNNNGEIFIAWGGKVFYLIALAWTFYEMGAHFSGL